MINIYLDHDWLVVCGSHGDSCHGEWEGTVSGDSLAVSDVIRQTDHLGPLTQDDMTGKPSLVTAVGW